MRKFLLFITVFPYLALLDESRAEMTSPVIVTAKRARDQQIPPSDKSTTFTTEQINKNQYTQIIQVINATPGYTVVQSGDTGQQSSIFVRGTNSNHVQVRLDGMRINAPDAGNGAFDAALLSTQNLSAITLIRGGQSSLYGADAVGGVIILTTPTGIGDFEEKIRLEAGSRQTANAYGHLLGNFDHTGLYIGVSGLRTQGIHQTPLDYQSPNGNYPRLPYRQGSYAVRLDHKIDDSTNTNLSLISRLTTGELSYQLKDRAVPQQRQQNLQRAILTTNPTSWWQSILGAGYLTTHQINAKHDRSFSKTNGQRRQIDWIQNITIPIIGSLNLSAETSKDTSNQQDLTSQASYHQTNHGIGALWQRSWQWISLDASVRQDKVSDFHQVVSHREGITLTPTKTTRLIASHGTSFKTPTLYQLYIKTPYFSGNPQLKAEKARQWEAGFAQRLFGQFLWEETYFINHIHDLIDATPDWTSLTNIGRVRTSGIESVLTWVGNQNWSGDINHTFTKAKNIVTGQGLLRRPRNKLSGRLYYTCNEWLFSTELTRIGQRLDISPLTYKIMRAKPYVLVNLKVKKDVSDTFNIFGRIENLFNRRIQDPIGYRKAGFSIYIGLEKTID